MTNYFKKIYRGFTQIYKIQKLKKRKHCSIEKSCYFQNCTFEGFNSVGGQTSIDGSNIGFGTYIGSNCSLRKCLVGRFSSIGSSVKIEYHNHPTDWVSTYPGFYSEHNYLTLLKGRQKFEHEFLKCGNSYIATIGNDVWIGSDVIIKGGVSVGDGAIIGMGAVVTKDVPPYAVVGGVPAKVLKYRFDEKIITKFLKLKWWNWDIDLIIERKELFSDVKSFLDEYCK